MSKPYPRKQRNFGHRPLDLAVRQVSAAGGTCRQITEAATGHTLLYVNGATDPMRYDGWGEPVVISAPLPPRDPDELPDKPEPFGPLGLL